MEISNQRVEEIINFIKNLNLDKKYQKEFTHEKIKNLSYINESLTHSSANNKFNYENLEFLGDAVLRLIASDFIKNQYPHMQVGERSELRSHLVSDKWLEQVGEKINIKSVLIIGPKALRDKSASATIQAEATEALIGALYESIKILDPIKNWLNPFWVDKSKKVLADPHKQNYKSALQEWTQAKGLSIPTYKTIEINKKHNNPKRFFCTVYIQNISIAEGWGKSMKQAEKEAANEALTAVEKNVLKL
ncbi:ribonuclease III [Prochlorococcus marinus]|uniref:Ribonuclease 3 n=1 Tax=Prochlorococcus marinus XMU1408 TaxID=2213228 RepID=A0A318R219_PROMR|nr:ribonuclease III [Prochlorococcus marinus]MBW3042828.1 ribonuclease III [Prochlorococcus marinus str. XMU1408]PYE00655.1 ribonuclease III [Prochlorococcus marinus XMU1408]